MLDLLRALHTSIDPAAAGVPLISIGILFILLGKSIQLRFILELQAYLYRDKGQAGLKAGKEVNKLKNRAIKNASCLWPIDDYRRFFFNIT